MRARAWLSALSLAALPAAAAAAPDEDGLWHSEVVPLRFEDQWNAFEALSFGTGPVTLVDFSGVLVSIDFGVYTSGGVIAAMSANSDLAWPEALTHTIEGVPDSGYLRTAFDLELRGQLNYDIVVDSGTVNLLDLLIPGIPTRYAIDDVDAIFDPLLLRGGAPPMATLEVKDTNLIDPIEFDFSLLDWVVIEISLGAGVLFYPELEATIAGDRVATTVDGDTYVLDVAGEYSEIPVPSTTGYASMQSQYFADVAATLGFVAQGYGVVSFDTIVGGFDIDLFNIPLPILERTFSENRAFEPVSYEHPLPVAQPDRASHDFGDLYPGTNADALITLDNPGRMDLEALIYVEGDGFSVFPNELFVPVDGAGQVQVEVDVADLGLATGVLVIESNDPSRPRIEIPLSVNGVDESVDLTDDDPLVEPDEFKADVTGGCTCASPRGGVGAAWTLLPLVAAVARRRRR